MQRAWFLPFTQLLFQILILKIAIYHYCKNTFMLFVIVFVCFKMEGYETVSFDMMDIAGFVSASYIPLSYILSAILIHNNPLR